VEPVDQYVDAFIEKAALDWFGDYRARVARGAVVHQSRGDAQIRQGAYTQLAASVAMAA
jgi:nitrogen fixation protein NifB